MNRRFSQARWFAGVVALLVLVGVIVGAFALGMLPLSGDAALGPGRIAFVSDRDGDAEIYMMNSDGSGLVQLTDDDSSDLFPAWSQDGNRIAFASNRGNDAKFYDIYVMNSDGSDVEQLTDGCSNGQLAWSSDGDRIAFTSRGGIYVIDSDGGNAVQLMGTPHASCEQLFFSDLDGDGNDEVYRRNPDGTVELFTDYESIFLGDGFPAWSPDGRRIAFASGRNGNGLAVYVINVDGTGVERLTDNEYVNLDPAWSPDGSRIAFVSNRDGDDEIYVMNADGTGVVRLTENEYPDEVPSWSPDGGRIAFQSDRDGASRIFVMNADGTGVERLEKGHSPAWSPVLE